MAAVPEVCSNIKLAFFQKVWTSEALWQLLGCNMVLQTPHNLEVCLWITQAMSTAQAHVHAQHYQTHRQTGGQQASFDTIVLPMMKILLHSIHKQCRNFAGYWCGGHLGTQLAC